MVILIAVGGAALHLGAVVYGTKRPDPSPRWFGFHEVFHAFTVAAFAAHYVAASIAGLRPRRRPLTSPGGRRQPGALCQSPIRLPSVSVKYAAKPISPTGVISRTVAPPRRWTSARARAMSSTSMTTSGACHTP